MIHVIRLRSNFDKGLTSILPSFRETYTDEKGTAGTLTRKRLQASGSCFGGASSCLIKRQKADILQSKCRRLARVKHEFFVFCC